MQGYANRRFHMTYQKISIFPLFLSVFRALTALASHQEIKVLSEATRTPSMPPDLSSSKLASERITKVFPTSLKILRGAPSSSLFLTNFRESASCWELFRLKGRLNACSEMCWMQVPAYLPPRSHRNINIKLSGAKDT